MNAQLKYRDEEAISRFQADYGFSDEAVGIIRGLALDLISNCNISLTEEVVSEFICCLNEDDDSIVSEIAEDCAELQYRSVMRLIATDRADLINHYMFRHFSYYLEEQAHNLAEYLC